MARKPKPVLTFDIAIDELEMFLEDVNERLQAMESGLLRLEKKSDPETLNSVFRAAHTLKAFAGTVGHQPMADLTHTMETLFDEMRAGTLSPTQAIIDELLASIDILKALRDEIVTRRPSGAKVEALQARLDALQTGKGKQKQTPANLPSDQRRLTPEQVALLNEMNESGQNLLEIEIATIPEAYAPAARLYQATIALMEVGKIVVQRPELANIAEGDEHLWLIVTTSTEPDKIEQLLDEIDDLAKSRLKPYLPTEQTLPGETSGDGRSAESGPEAAPDKTVRISIERLDTLMNLVGELVTNRTRLLQIEDMLRTQYGKDGNVGALSELAPHFSHVVDQLQDEVMRARMLPIASLFNKFPRLVRDVARTAGKQVNLVIEGEATELDRAIIEAIGDPLIHLLRNAVDHGLETPEVRQAAGKSPTGVVRLTAAAVGGQIVVTVADDGQGIDPEKIRQAAIKHKLLAPEEAVQLTTDEIVDLIFQPNLSTAAEVTGVSGRGVGLDVVRTNIERLSGSVVVTSTLGQGTTFQLTLPLTLALIQTMLVMVRHTLYAIPVTSINGAMYVAEAAIHTVKGKSVLEWQESTLPLLDLHEIFSQSRLTATPSTVAKPSVVLVNWGKYQVGLIVDRIIGQQEIVVKSLSPLIGPISGLSGATILGDGRIALIVDVPGLINTVLRAQRTPPKRVEK
ncbi:MAG: chemotaxis protein CheA [Anaerolineae bacterium]|nr:chemotaxis protein CheA [Anaerolineae bacterium]